MVGIVFRTMMSMMIFMAMGFILVKTKRTISEYGKLMSTILVYCATPGMIIASFQEMEYDSVQALQLLKFFVISLLAQLAMFMVLKLILGKRIHENSFRIFTIGSFMGNVGFFGQPIIIALFPTSPVAACYCMMFATSMNILVFTLGEYLISGDRHYASLKRAIVNPTVISLFVALPLYLLRIKLPSFMFSSVASLRSMSAPLCMFLLGMRLAATPARQVFADPFTYGVSAMKLLVFPAFVFVVTSLIPGLDNVFRMTITITSAAPCASVILALAELHECERQRAASALLVSSIMCVLTLPLVVLVLEKLIG